MSQQSVAPQAVGSGKAIGAVIGGSVATIAVYLIQSATGHPLPADISAAVQTLVVTLIVWLVPHNLGQGT